MSPLLVQNILVSASGYMKVKQRYGKTYHEHRRWLLDFDTWSLDQALEYQNLKLREFIKFSSENSPFYRQLYNEIDLGRIQSAKDLVSLPVLEKEQLRAEINEIYTVGAKNSTEGHTGGTTGKSLVVRYTHEDEMRRMAMLDHFKSRFGFENLQMRKATFSGKHLVGKTSRNQVFWRYNAPAKQMLYSTFDISEANLKFYVNSLNSFKPQALDGFFTSLCDIASYVERNDIKLHFSPTAIFPTSETVTQSGRELLERVFGCKVVDQYASSEGAPFVTECEEGNRHVELSTGVFENYSSTEEILVTSFDTHGTPLIRYRIGDTMKLANEPSNCCCGAHGPEVLSIGGRSDDHLIRIDGAKINGGHVANLFKNMPNALIRAQVVQERVGEVRILLQIDESRYRNDLDGLLAAEFENAFKDSTKLRIEHVKEIPREASGKIRFIKNTVSK